MVQLCTYVIKLKTGIGTTKLGTRIGATKLRTGIRATKLGTGIGATKLRAGIGSYETKSWKNHLDYNVKHKHQKKVIKQNNSLT